MTQAVLKNCSKFVGTASLLTLMALSASAQTTDFSLCDFTGDYENTCVRSLESDREGGVVLIWSPEEVHSCSGLQDTATLASDEYCTGMLGGPSVGSTRASRGGVSFTCDGVTSSTYISDRDESFAELLNDDIGVSETSGFPELPEGATVAYSKFVCSND